MDAYGSWKEKAQQKGRERKGEKKGTGGKESQGDGEHLYILRKGRKASLPKVSLWKCLTLFQIYKHVPI